MDRMHQETSGEIRGKSAFVLHAPDTFLAYDSEALGTLNPEQIIANIKQIIPSPTNDSSDIDPFVSV